MENQNQVVIETRNLKIKLKKNETVIDYGDLKINKGDFVLLEGKNGGGKSTFLNCIASFNENDYFSCEGDLLINGESIFSSNYDSDKARGYDMVYVDQRDEFTSGQSPYKSLISSSIISLQYIENNKKKTLKENIKQKAFEYYKNYLCDFFNSPYNKKGTKTYEYLKNNPQKDLNFMYFKRTSSLSGGQQKLIHILQGIIKIETIGSNILLMDEPLNNLDKENKKILVNVINKLREVNKDLVIILITHCSLFPGVNTRIRIENGKAILSHDTVKVFDCLR